jgi:hypothetical protein
VGAEPAVLGSRYVGEAETVARGREFLRIDAERRDHGNAVRRAAQVAEICRNREGRIVLTGWLQEHRSLDKFRRLKREIDLDRARVGKAADAAQCAEVMVEGTVLLHQDHDMLDIIDRARAFVGWDRQRFRNGRAEGTRERARAYHLQEVATIGTVHQMISPLRRRYVRD